MISTPPAPYNWLPYGQKLATPLTGLF